MKETAILMSGSMVGAALREIDPKTQTRRVLKAHRSDECPAEMWPYALKDIAEWREQEGRWFGLMGWRTLAYSDCPQGVGGDRLWVRETAKCGFRSEQSPQNKGCIGVDYRAGGSLMRDYALDRRGDYPWFPSRSHNLDGSTRWTPAIHMPRWASRIQLEVEDVRVERVQEITEADAIAEGVEQLGANPVYWRNYETDTFGPGCIDYTCLSARESFRTLWNSLNETRGSGWDVNPWVWVIQFKRIVP